MMCTAHQSPSRDVVSWAASAAVSGSSKVPVSRSLASARKLSDARRCNSTSARRARSTGSAILSAPSCSRRAAVSPKCRMRREATPISPVMRPSTISGAVTSERMPALARRPRCARASMRSSLITAPGAGAADGKVSSVRLRNGLQGPSVSPIPERTSHSVSSVVASEM